MLRVYVVTVLRDGFAAKVGRGGETDERERTRNIVSWKLKVWPETERPERPTLAAKGRVKA